MVRYRPWRRSAARSGEAHLNESSLADFAFVRDVPHTRAVSATTVVVVAATEARTSHASSRRAFSFRDMGVPWLFWGRLSVHTLDSTFRPAETYPK